MDLFDLVGAGRGGDPLVRERLDTFFSTALSDAPGPAAEAQKTITAFGIFYAGNQYAPSNEHDLHAPYLYDYIGEPWKTQKIMRGYQMLFRPTPDGMPGNDDLGSMSAWYIWSALGFYPLAGGAPVYATGSPMFEEAVIRSGRRRTSHRACPRSLACRALHPIGELGDEALERPWFTHEELFDAGEVSFEMGLTPNEAWGADPSLAPPSMSSHPLERLRVPRGRNGARRSNDAYLRRRPERARGNGEGRGSLDVGRNRPRRRNDLVRDRRPDPGSQDRA